MSPRQARRERREAERKAKKLELKKSRLTEAQPRPTPPEVAGSNLPDIQPCGNQQPPPQPAEGGSVSQLRRTQANRANAKLSTGPRTANGKLASSRNSTRHGLASGTLLIPGEDPAAFEALLHDLLEEHQPATPSEELLVKEMAQSYWLSQRAIRLQNTCFTADGVNEKQLSLFLRYGTAHERRFYKALNSLLQLKKEAARAERGFVSQRPVTPAPQTGFVSQTGNIVEPAYAFVSQNSPQPANDIPPGQQKTIQAA